MATLTRSADVAVPAAKQVQDGYHPEPDKEARALLRLRCVGVRAPAVYSALPAEAVLVLEFIAGETVKDLLSGLGRGPFAGDVYKRAHAVVSAAGRAIRTMHDAEVIHGDLTTSNMIVQEGTESEIVLIDFGLSTMSASEEDKAVDLYVFERAVQAAHPGSAEMLNDAFFEAYCEAKSPDSSAAVMVRLEEVRSRGRKRDMTG